MVSPRNEPVPGIPYFYPSSPLPPGSATALSKDTPTIFTPLRIRSKTFQNRIFVAPMCSYSCAPSGPLAGALTSWHTATLGQYAIKGCALTFIEATAVAPEGRISPNDSSLWNDAQQQEVKRLADHVHAAGGKLGIQLAHAGRKASTVAQWLGSVRGQSVLADESVGGWPRDVIGPSPIRWSKEGYADPKEMTVEDIARVTKAFAESARRAVEAGVDVIEIHGAHGYLLSSFNSPITNRRTDQYGGSFMNRIRFNVEVIKAVREAIPDDVPLFYRITATEWMEESEEAKEFGTWTVDDSIRFAKLMPGLGVDLLDVSSGGNHEKQRLLPSSTYQVDIAGRIRNALTKDNLSMFIGAVGMITGAEQARDIVQGAGNGSQDGVNGGFDFDSSNEVEAKQARDIVQGDHAVADVVLVARQMMREPEWVFRVAYRLGVDVQWPIQYGRGKFVKGSVV